MDMSENMENAENIKNPENMEDIVAMGNAEYMDDMDNGESPEYMDDMDNGESPEYMDTMETIEAVLCGASYYEQKYYFNPEFSGLPEDVKTELQILCVTFTEKVGGVLTLVYDQEGKLLFNVQSMEGDQRFDEIGSALEIKKLQQEKMELLESLELYYRVFVLHESIN